MAEDSDLKKLGRFVLLCCGIVAIGTGMLSRCSEEQEERNARVAKRLKAIKQSSREKAEREAQRRKESGEVTRADVLRSHGAISAITARTDKKGRVTNLVNIDTFVGDGAREDRSAPNEGAMAGRNGCGITDTWGPKSTPKRGSVKMRPMGSSTHPRPKPETLNKTAGEYKKPTTTQSGSKTTVINVNMFNTDGR